METTHLPKDTPGPQGSSPDQPPFLGSNVPDNACCHRPSVQPGRLQSQLSYRAHWLPSPLTALGNGSPEHVFPSGRTAAVLSDVLFWFCSVEKIPIAPCDQ